MKSHRKSRSAENRNARKEMIARGGSHMTRTLVQPSPRDRRWRRANRHALARLDVLALDAGGVPARPTVTVRMDPYTRMILGFDVS